MKFPYITIFTSTYNRGLNLKMLYASLQRQTVKLFEWILIDDGSMDETEALIAEWKRNTNDFPIYYMKVENGGKHRAINKGLKLANGRLFFIVDSDDYISDYAIERIIYWEDMIKEEKYYAGVAGLCRYADGQPLGKSFVGEFVDATSLEREKYNIYGDKAEVFYTNVLKKYPFPEFENEKFCSEALIWNRIAKAGYRLRWFNENIKFVEYQENGLSARIKQITRENPRAGLLYYKELCESQATNSILFYKNASLYYSFAQKYGISNGEIKKQFKLNFWKMLLVRFFYVCRFVLRK